MSWSSRGLEAVSCLPMRHAPISWYRTDTRERATRYDHARERRRRGAVLLCLLLLGLLLSHSFTGSVTRLSSEIKCLEGRQAQAAQTQHSSRGHPAHTTTLPTSDDDSNTKSAAHPSPWSIPLDPSTSPNKIISSTSLQPYQIT